LRTLKFSHALWVTPLLFSSAIAGSFSYGDYADVLDKSMLFYDAQRSGAHLERYNWDVKWRKPAALNDGSEVGVDLSGGWFDAGDHVKFGLPMAYSAATLGWGVYTFESAYRQSGNLNKAKDNLRFVLDYFLKAYVRGSDSTDDDLFYYQVGNGGADHAFWGPPEDMTMSRPAYACTASSPCSAVTGDTVAALAIGALLFSQSDATYAQTLLDNAKALYAFSTAHEGEDGYTAADSFYYSSGYKDELAWAALWLYKATQETHYLDEAKTYASAMNDTTYWVFGWNDASNAVNLMLANITQESGYKSKIQAHLNHWIDSSDKRTSGGLVFVDEWGSLRYSANIAFLALSYASLIDDNAETLQKYRSFAASQIDYILGDNPRDSSYVVGFGQNAPINPHHRAAHASPEHNIDSPTNNTYELTGALVGGPKSKEDNKYIDDRHDYQANEVATDYNAGFSGAVAGMYALSAPDTPPVSDNSMLPIPVMFYLLN
jgi:endoglucanase